MGKNLGVVIVDDYGVIRAGLKRTIDNEHDMETVGEALDGEEAIRVVARCSRQSCSSMWPCRHERCGSDARDSKHIPSGQGDWGDAVTANLDL
jgi:hypothetical protein